MREEGACDASLSFMLRLPDDMVVDDLDAYELDSFLQHARTPKEMWDDCAVPAWLVWAVCKQGREDSLKPAYLQAAARVLQYLITWAKKQSCFSAAQIQVLEQLPPITDSASTIVAAHTVYVFDATKLCARYAYEALRFAGYHNHQHALGWAIEVAGRCGSADGTAQAMEDAEMAQQLTDIRALMPEPPIPGEQADEQHKETADDPDAVV